MIGALVKNVYGILVRDWDEILSFFWAMFLWMAEYDIKYLNLIGCYIWKLENLFYHLIFAIEYHGVNFTKSTKICQSTFYLLRYMPLKYVMFYTLRWRHNDHAGVSNHQPPGCLLNRLFRRKSKKTSKLRVTGLCAGNSPGTGEFSAQMARYAENVSIWWRHHE